MKPFSRRVYAVVRAVPRGRVITYGAIARLLGDPRKARQVGWAMATADGTRPPIPAHRVINARGELSGGDAFGGYHVQRARLEAEGVIFQADGRVDLDRYLWLPPLDPGADRPTSSEQPRKTDQHNGSDDGDQDAR